MAACSALSYPTIQASTRTTSLVRSGIHLWICFASSHDQPHIIRMTPFSFDANPHTIIFTHAPRGGHLFVCFARQIHVSLMPGKAIMYLSLYEADHASLIFWEVDLCSLYVPRGESHILIYIPWVGYFMLHLLSTGSWLPSSSCLLKLSRRGRWLPSSRRSSQICLRDPDSLSKMSLSSQSWLPPFALEVLIPSSRCIHAWGPDSLLKVLLTSRSWFLLESLCHWAPDSLIKVPLSLMSWFPSQRPFILEVIFIPSSRCIHLCGSDFLIEVPLPQELNPSLRLPCLRCPDSFLRSLCPRGRDSLLEVPFTS